MSQSDGLLNCPICRESYILGKPKVDHWRLTYDCERCGKYTIDDALASDENPPWAEIRHLVSAWVRRENKAGVIPTIAHSEGMYAPEWANQFKQMGFPETMNEKLDTLLLGYADLIKGNYKQQISYGLPYLVAEIAVENVEQLNGLTDFLKEMGYVDEHPRITASGWRHIDELRKTTASSSSAFVAMWFDDSTMKYRQAAIAAIEYCGYKAIVVDQQEYNDFIMNQVVALIRQSRFLVADFTARPELEEGGKVKYGVRGGVYWEAGLAFGLGKSVIHTCRDDTASRQRIHFDVHQYNTIFWTEETLGVEIQPLEQSIANPDFTQRLVARIRGTVGSGNYQGNAI